MIDPNLARWIKASVNLFFAQALAPTPVIVGNTGYTAAIKNKSSWIEVRVNGPRILPGAQLEIRAELEVSLLCSAVLTDDAYLIDRVVGLCQSAMLTIPILKLGDGAGDDQSNIGCMVLRDDVARPIDTIAWGQLDTNTDVTQSVVEGYYAVAL